MRIISGEKRGIALKTPAGLKTRPTADRVKEAMFSIIQFDLPGARVLDLFAGTGQLGLEALSRGADRVVFIDAGKDACKLVQDNINRTAYEKKATVLCADYVSYLSNCRDKFNIILLDPPYNEIFLENALKMITEIDILQSSGIIVTERPLGKELSMDFPGFSRSKDYKYGKTLLTLFRKV